MNLPTPHSRIRRVVPLALVLFSATIAVAAYMQALDYPFVADDSAYLLENTKLAGLRLTELWHLFVEPYNRLSEFLPLRDLSYWLDMTLFGLTPSAFRAHNILLYLLCLPLIYATTSGLWRYFRPSDALSAPWAAAAVTALFALHPALVEPVVWISGRKYVLPNLFSMLALWFAINAKREHGLSALHAAAALTAFVAAMLSKSSYVAVAPVIAMLWLIFWFDIPAPDRRRSQLLWPLAILLLAGFLFLVFIAVSGGAGGAGIAGATKVAAYYGIEAVTRTLAVLGRLARLAVSPESRHFYYPVFEDQQLPVMVVLGVAVLAAATAGVVMTLRKRSLEGFALVVFLLLCMPYIQLISYQTPSPAQDRYLSLAAWPIVLLIVTLSWRLRPLPRTVLLLAIALSWGLQTIERPRDWRSNEALIDADLRAYPGHYMPTAFYKIIILQLPQGLYQDASNTANSITDPEIKKIMIGLVKASHAVNVVAVSTGKPQEALTLLWELGVDLKQPPAQVKWNPSLNLLWVRMQNELVGEWSRLIKQFPDDESVNYNAGLWMLNTHKYKNAAAHLRTATESQRLPESMRGTAFKNLGLALMNSGRVAEAEAPLLAALEQSPPDLRTYCLLSKVYEQTGRPADAARAEAGCRNRESGGEATQ